MDALIASLVLFAGLILMAAAGTALLAAGARGLRSPAREEPSQSQPRIGEEPLRADSAVPVSIFCPETGTPAGVMLAVDRAEEPARLTVLGCERFPDGPPTCGMECLPEPVAA